MRRSWDLRIQKLLNAKVMPTIVRSFCATSMNVEKHLRKIPAKHNSTALIKSALLVSSNILRCVPQIEIYWLDD